MQKKLVVKNHPNADALNRLIYEFVAAIEKKELELWQQGKRISLELLKDALAARENNSSFISFFKQEVSNSSLRIVPNAIIFLLFYYCKNSKGI